MNKHEIKIVGPERRSITSTNLKVEKRSDGKPQISGYAAVFYRIDDPATEYQLYDCGFERMVEHVMPGAFNRVLTEKKDVRALFNHDANCVLGRTASGTCRLSIDGTGLRYEIDPPDTDRGRELVTLIERGDISGSSFTFHIREQTFREVENEGKLTVYRELRDVDIDDVGPVVFPAYTGTTASTRNDPGAFPEVRSAYGSWKDLQAAELKKKQQREEMDKRMKQIAKNEGW